jgi:AcrR family transcriptional regulator/DNA-binding MarR family transcriptional regulator
VSELEVFTPPRPHGGVVPVSELQRARLLEATFALTLEQGYAGLTARKLAGRAGVSPKTFYQCFRDCEDCFLAAFEHGLGQLAEVVLPAYLSEREWSARIRAALAALLSVLEQSSALARLVFVQALCAGPRVLARRAQVLEQVAGVLDEARAEQTDAYESPPLTAEGTIGAVFTLIHMRLLRPAQEPLPTLLNPLMAMIVLAYRGRAKAARELARPAPSPAPAGPTIPHRADPAGEIPQVVGREQQGQEGAGRLWQPIDPPAQASTINFRMTIRTRTVLAAVGELSARGSSPSNREIARRGGVRDAGQISRLLARLAELGLVVKTGGSQGRHNAWRLTASGREMLDATDPRRGDKRASASDPRECLL